jgi:hypothetical protein
MNWRTLAQIGLVAACLMVTSEAKTQVAQAWCPERSECPVNGFIPDEKTAIRVGESILAAFYGEKQIHRERPLTAYLSKRPLGNPRRFAQAKKPFTSCGGQISNR